MYICCATFLHLYVAVWYWSAILRHFETIRTGLRRRCSGGEVGERALTGDKGCQGGPPVSLPSSDHTSSGLRTGATSVPICW